MRHRVCFSSLAAFMPPQIDLDVEKWGVFDELSPTHGAWWQAVVVLITAVAARSMLLMLLCIVMQQRSDILFPFTFTVNSLGENTDSRAITWSSTLHIRLRGHAKSDRIPNILLSWWNYCFVHNLLYFKVTSRIMNHTNGILISFRAIVMFRNFSEGLWAVQFFFQLMWYAVAFSEVRIIITI